jgi:hypothetical protein
MDGGLWMVVAGVLAQAQPSPGVKEPDRGRSGVLAVSDARDGAPASVEVRSDMGKRFRLTEAVLVLDGQEVARRTAAKGEELERSFQLWASGRAPVNGSERVSIDGLLHSGEHALTVRLTYEGRNVGPIAYLDDIKLHAESMFAFKVGTGDRPAVLQVVARERADARLPLQAEPVLTVSPQPGSGIVPITPATNRW